MNRKSVAVLDVGSAEVTALIGQRGVNNTFVFKGIYTEKYDGFADGDFFNPAGLRRAIFSAIGQVENSCGDKITEIYVGVPGEFEKVETRRQLISFQRKRKVTGRDVSLLYSSAYGDPPEGYSLMRSASVFYVLSDKRRVIDPVGMISDSLEGYLSYFVVSDRFSEVLRNILTEYGMKKVNFLPVSLAEALYLIPSEMRDEYAILLDIGYISMTFSVVCGNGIAYESACSVGGGHIPACMINDIDIPFDVAEAILKKVNLSSIDNPESVIEYIDKTEIYTVSVSQVKEKVKEGLDLICEVINKCLELCGDRNLDYKPILLTGGGITSIRGAREHMSKRLNKVVDILTPNLPYYNKAAQSSLLSLLNMALNDQRENSFIHKILYGFGG